MLYTAYDVPDDICGSPKLRGIFEFEQCDCNPIERLIEPGMLISYHEACGRPYPDEKGKVIVVTFGPGEKE